MQFTLEISDSEAQRIATAVCAHDGYGPPDLESAIEHTKQHIFNHLARLVIEQEASAAAAQAADAVRTNATDPLAQALFASISPQAQAVNVPDADGPIGETGPTVESGPTGPTGAAFA